MATSKSNGKQQQTRLDLATLESMRTHDLAELLSNFVLILRRLPNVPFSDLGQVPATNGQQQSSETTEQQPTRVDFVNKAHSRVNGHHLPEWTGKE